MIKEILRSERKGEGKANKDSYRGTWESSKITVEVNKIRETNECIWSKENDFFFQLSTQSVAQSTFPDARIFKKKSIGEKKTKKKVEYLSMKAIFFIFTFLCRF